MRNIHKILFMAATLVTQQVYAADNSKAMADSVGGKACSVIANACLNAGYNNPELANKGFWSDCMKPIILGKTVTGITVGSEIVKSCRTHKIAEMKNDLNEMEKAG